MSASTTFCPSCGHRVAGTAFCASCGTDQRQIAAAPAAETPPVAPLAERRPADDASHGERVSCPVCGASDALRRVSNIIDSGRSQTTGESSSVNLDNFDVTVSDYSFATTVHLAQRLTVPNEPTDRSETMTVVGVLITSMMFLAAIGSSSGSSGGQAVMVWLVAILCLALPRALRALYQRRSNILTRVADYGVAESRARSGYYCARDDVAFIPGWPALRPEKYVWAIATQRSPGP